MVVDTNPFLAETLVLHLWSNMKTATVRELRNRYTELLEWLEAGEDVRITRRGVVIARLVPEKHSKIPRGLDWTKSAAFALDRLNLRPLTAEESAKLLDDNKGPY
jgi:prevent-host-death family protein